MEAIQGYPRYNPYPTQQYQQYQPQQYQQYQPQQYQQYQQQKPQATASAVTINIIEPKAYAGSEAPVCPPPMYNYPPASFYDQSGMMYPMPPVMMPPVQMPMPMPLPAPMPQPVQEVPVNQSQVVNQAPVMPQPMPQPIQQPMPQPMPQPVQQQPVPQPMPQPVQQQPVQQPVPQPVQEQPQQAPELSVNDLPAINAALSQGDTNVKAAAIEAVARIGQGDANTYTALINQAMTDTSKMGGEEKQVADNNRKHAMWTLSILNKNQNPQVALPDLPGASQFLQVIKSDPNPEMRKAAISALVFLAKPEDAKVLEKIFATTAKKDKSPEVVALANDALANIQQSTKAAA